MQNLSSKVQNKKKNKSRSKKKDKKIKKKDKNLKFQEIDKLLNPFFLPQNFDIGNIQYDSFKNDKPIIDDGLGETSFYAGDLILSDDFKNATMMAKLEQDLSPNFFNKFAMMNGGNKGTLPNIQQFNMANLPQLTPQQQFFPNLSTQQIFNQQNPFLQNPFSQNTLGMGMGMGMIPQYQNLIGRMNTIGDPNIQKILENDPYYVFNNKYQHIDETVPVKNLDKQRMENLMNVTGTLSVVEPKKYPIQYGKLPKKIATISGYDLS